MMKVAQDEGDSLTNARTCEDDGGAASEQHVPTPLPRRAGNEGGRGDSHSSITATKPSMSPKCSRGWWCPRPSPSARTTRLALLYMLTISVVINLLIQHHRTSVVLIQIQQQVEALAAGLLSAAAMTASGSHSAPPNEPEVDVEEVSDPSSSLYVSNANLTKNLPDWLVSYMDWHRQIKPTITEDNWDQHKYLVLRCLCWFPFCSGTSDRLRTFLFLLYLAQSDPNQEHRIFLIHWSRPAALEEFLVPPSGGLDWRVPDWLLPKLELGNESHWKDVPWNEESLLQDYRIKSYYTVVEFSFIFQLHQLIDRLERQYRDSFHALFKPVPPVQALVDKTKAELGLTNQPYTAVHLRMKYTSIDRDDDNIWRALQCAAKIGNPNAPIFVASDSGEMAARALEVAVRRNLSRAVVARTDYHLYPSLHIDMGNDFLNPYGDDWKNHNASEYYTVFSDLLLLGDSSCVVAGTGSYGKWGSQLSKNVSCFGNYMSGEGC